MSEEPIWKKCRAHPGLKPSVPRACWISMTLRSVIRYRRTSFLLREAFQAIFGRPPELTGAIVLCFVLIVNAHNKNHQWWGCEEDCVSAAFKRNDGDESNTILYIRFEGVWDMLKQKAESLTSLYSHHKCFEWWRGQIVCCGEKALIERSSIDRGGPTPVFARSWDPTDPSKFWGKACSRTRLATTAGQHTRCSAAAYYTALDEKRATTSKFTCTTALITSFEVDLIWTRIRIRKYTRVIVRAYLAF